MQLATKQLATSGLLFQPITPTKDINLHAIRPHLYKALAPGGTLKVSVRDGNNKIIKESETITISTISTANYFHGYVRFLISMPLKSGTEYRISLAAAGGYTYAESDHVAWVIAHFDLAKVSSTYNPTAVFDSPLDLELWEKK